jgi:hypothetical protein
LWEKETTPQMTSIFASNGPQPFTSSTHQRLTFGQHFFWDITVEQATTTKIRLSGAGAPCSGTRRG